MSIFRKIEKGITLIALVITIIAMLILAGVVIAIMINGGLFEEAGRAKIATIKGQYHDRLYVATMSAYTEKRGQGKTLTRDEVLDLLKEERNSKREEWIAEANKGIKKIVPDDERTIVVTSKEGYIFHVIVYEDGRIEIVDKGEGEPPKEIPILDDDLETGNIKFIYTPSEWTNGDVEVTIETSITGYEIEYSKTGDETDWLTYVTGIEYEDNGVIYARLSDGEDVSNVATGNVINIDKEKPRIGTIIPRTNGATFSGTDNLSKIIGYGYSESSSTEPTTWTNVPETLEIKDVEITNLTASTKYYICIKDQAGNTENKEFTTGAMPTLDTNLTTGNIRFTYTPNTWTNGNVQVTIETEIEGYTLEYSKTGTETSWSNYVGGVEYTANGTIYARLTDGTNITNVASRKYNKHR